jgi:hypothetical protein
MLFRQFLCGKTPWWAAGIIRSSRRLGVMVD